MNLLQVTITKQGNRGDFSVKSLLLLSITVLMTIPQSADAP